MKKAALRYLTLLFALSSAAAPAQMLLAPSTGWVSGDFSDPTLRLADGRAAYCYVIQTQPGEKWQIQFRAEGLWPVVSVGRGDCATMTIDAYKHASGSGKLDFVAGGGEYLVQFTGLKLELPISSWDAELGVQRLKSPGPGLVVKWRDVPLAFSLNANTNGVAKSGMLPPGTPVQSLPENLSMAPVSSRGSEQAASRAAGEIFRDCPECPDMVVIPGGSFTIGSPSTEPGRARDEGPRHLVTLGAFAIGRSEVTFDQWNACVAGGGCVSRPGDQGWGQGRRPVINVNMIDALSYVIWLGSKTGQTYLLPAEWEWEYAARAGTDTPWSTGEAILTEDANILNEHARTLPVGAFPPNAFGLVDMYGNVAELTISPYSSTSYADRAAGVPEPAFSPSSRFAVRGGHFADEPGDVRSARRKSEGLRAKSPTIGFRVARAL
jgi:formylglycine-generating enzyme required for sulfatase activity